MSLINGGILGAPSANQTVKFQYATSIATAAGSNTPGALTFAADSNGNAAIYAQGTLVSSAIQKVVATAATGAKHGGKTVTVTYIGDAGSIQTSTFNVIDEAGLEAYFANSKTIALDSNNIYEVKTDGKTVLVDATLGLKTGLAIDYKAAVSGTPAHIALIDASNNELSTVAVSDIIGNGILDHTDYDSGTNTLKLFFKQADGTLKEVDVDLSEMFDIDDWAVETGSEDFLHLAIDASTAEIGVKLADVTYTAKSGNTPANLTVDTTNGKVLDAADAIPAIKSYVDAVSSDNGISAEGDSYIDASVDAVNNKKINIEAQVADLTVAKDGTADTTIAGTSGKLVDAADAATKTASFVNARIAEEIDKLGNTEDSSAEFIKVEVTTEDGDVSAVTVTEKVGSITGTASTLTGESGLIDGEETAEAVSTYVEGKIAALDASLATADLNAAGGIFTKTTLKEVDGVVTEITVANQIAVTAETEYVKDVTDPDFEVTTNGLLTGTDAENLKKYVDDIAAQLRDETGAIDSSKSDADSANFISIHEEQEDGEITVFTVDSSYGVYNYTAGTHTFGTPTNGLAKVADTQTFVQNVVESLDLLASASDASASDASNFVKTTISETDGIVKNESVEVTYATVTAAPGDITVTQNGIVKGDVLADAIEGALTWTVLP